MSAKKMLKPGGKTALLPGGKTQLGAGGDPCCCAECLDCLCRASSEADPICGCGTGVGPTKVTITIAGVNVSVNGTYDLVGPSDDGCVWSGTFGAVVIQFSGTGDFGLDANAGGPTLFQNADATCVSQGQEFANTIGTGTATVTWTCP